MIKTITAPLAYPLTLAQAKEYARIDATDSSQDATLTMLIAAMVDHAEHLTGRAFVERTLEYSAEYFEHTFELPFPPLLEIVSAKYTDINEAEQTIAASGYEIDTTSEPGRVRPVSSESWPSIGYGFNPVRIRYKAGYRAPGSPQDLTDNDYLPQNLRLWMAARIATIYDNRDQQSRYGSRFDPSSSNSSIVGVSVQPIPRDFADGLLDSLIVGSRLF